MNTREDKTESEIHVQIKKLIAVVRGSRIAPVWYEFKNGKPPIEEDRLSVRMGSSSTQAS